MAPVLTTRRVWLARGLALAVDAFQIGLLPLFAGGAAVGVDVAAAALFTWLCGFHHAFLPTAVAEVLPMVDLFPPWTAAVTFATRASRRTLPAAADKAPAVADRAQQVAFGGQKPAIRPRDSARTAARAWSRRRRWSRPRAKGAAPGGSGPPGRRRRCRR